MPCESDHDLPEDVRDALPKHAQKIYREAHNRAWEQYDDGEDGDGDSSREATAHAVAWSAVKDKY